MDAGEPVMELHRSNPNTCFRASSRLEKGVAENNNRLGHTRVKLRSHLVVTMLANLSSRQIRHQKHVVRFVRPPNVPAPPVVGDLEMFLCERPQNQLIFKVRHQP